MELNIDTPKRLHWVDIAKGILIFMVILAHFDVMSITAGVDHAGTKYIRVLNFLFTSYYMAAFFVLTGYTTNFKKEFSTFLISSFKSLIIPAFCFSVLTQILLAILFKDRSYVDSIIKPEFFIYGFKSYWFLIALFWARVCYWLLNRFIPSDIAKGGILLVFMLIGLYLSSKYRDTPNSPFTNNPFFYLHFMRMAFYLWIGQMYKKYESSIKLEYLMVGGVFCVVLSIVFRALGILIPNANYLINFDFTIKEFIKYLFFTLSGSGLIIYLSKKLRSNKLLEFFGRNSLTVYVTHFCIIIYIYYITKPLLRISDSSVYGAMYSFFVAILTFFVCYFIIILFNKRPFKFLLGKF